MDLSKQIVEKIIEDQPGKNSKLVHFPGNSSKVLSLKKLHGQYTLSLLSEISESVLILLCYIGQTFTC